MIIVVNRDVRVEADDRTVLMKIIPADQAGSAAQPVIVEAKRDTAEHLRSALEKMFQMMEE